MKITKRKKKICKNKIFLNSQVPMTKFARVRFQGSIEIFIKPILADNVKAIAG